MSGDVRALFVEEEVGRVFCSEECITEFFSPEVGRLEKEYLRLLSPDDLSGDEKEKLAHLRWITLQEPDEVWRQKTLSGDHRYTLITEFHPDSRAIWCVCICLFLRNEPSFLYISFSTRNRAMVNHYRRGEQIRYERPRSQDRQKTGSGEATIHSGSEEKPQLLDGLADAWTEEETLRAQVQNRRKDDIPESEFELYSSCLQETLEEPDEVWTHQSTDDESLRVYHFLRYFEEGKSGAWYVIVARESEEDSEQLEVLDAFPTRDEELVERYRTGNQEIGAEESAAVSRLVH